MLLLLAEEAVGGRDDPAGGHQGPGAELRPADVDGHHPGVGPGQRRRAPHDPSSGWGHALPVLRPTHHPLPGRLLLVHVYEYCYATSGGWKQRKIDTVLSK